MNVDPLPVVDAASLREALRLAALVDAGEVVLFRDSKDPLERFFSAVGRVFVDEVLHHSAYIRLVSLLGMVGQEPLDGWSRVTAEGWEIHEALLRAAALAPCTTEDGFDPIELEEFAEDELMQGWGAVA